MAFDAKRKRLYPLQQYPGVERRNRGTCVAQDDGTDTCHESCFACHIGEHCPVIGRVRLGKCGVFVGIGFPVEAAGLHDDASQRTAMTADELRGAVHNDVCSMFDGTDEEGRKGVVHDEHDVMLVGDRRYRIEVGHIGIGIAEGLGIDDLGVGTDGGFKRLKVVDVHYAVFHALCGKRMGDKVEGASIEVVGGYNVY